MTQGKLVLLRHGQSTWNAQKRFTGWVNVPLNDKGRTEALAAAKELEKYRFDLVITSTLVRAIETADIIVESLHQQKVSVIRSEKINERSYGSLEGYTHKEIEDQFGAEQVRRWRRSLYEQPPKGESLQNTYDRVIPYFENIVVPYLAEGKIVLMVAHGNSLRALVMYLHGMDEGEIEKLSIATAQPIIYKIPSPVGRYEKLA